MQQVTCKMVWSFSFGCPVSTVSILGALQRQAALQGAFVKIANFINFKGFLVEFLENRRA